jgi:hypothetical protein
MCSTAGFLGGVVSSSCREMVSNSIGDVGSSTALTLTDTCFWIASFEPFMVSSSTPTLFLTRYPFLRLINQKQPPPRNIAAAAANPAPAPMMVSLAYAGCLESTKIPVCVGEDVDECIGCVGWFGIDVTTVPFPRV